MRKSMAVAALFAVAVFVVAGPGSAATLSAGLCSFTGTTIFTNPVKTALEPNDFVFTGGIQCAGSTGTETPAPGLTGQAFTGDIVVQGDGNVSCQLSNTRGSLTATIPTGDDTRDVWSGTVSVVGSAQGVILGNISLIEHQTFDSGLGEWFTDSADSPGLNVIAGAITTSLSQADLDACQADGISQVTSSGTAAFAYSL